MSKHTVEDFLIAPLIEHFEAEPTDGIRNTLIEDYDDHSGEVLFAAVEYLKRNLLSKKGFPAPRRISEAIKACDVYRSQKGALSTGHITAENFLERQQEFAKANPKKIVSIEKGSFEWGAWEEYLHWLGQDFVLNLMNQYTKWGVVTRIPAEFDPSYAGRIATPKVAAE